MKAHYSGPELGQGFDSFAVEGQSFGSNRDGAWIDSEFCKVRRKRGAPDRFPLDAELGVGMAEEVHIERLRGVRTDRCELLTHVVQAEHRARKRAKPTCVGNCHCQCAALNTRHRGLNDRERYSKELLQSHSQVSLVFAVATPEMAQPHGMYRCVCDAANRAASAAAAHDRARPTAASRCWPRLIHECRSACAIVSVSNSARSIDSSSSGLGGSPPNSDRGPAAGIVSKSHLTFCPGQQRK